MSPDHDPSSSTPRAKIRSFVRREGRLTSGQERALAEYLPLWGLSFPAPTYDLPALFGRVAPITLEIGFGMGDALIQMADREREHDFIGIEVHRPGVGKCLMGCEELQLTNVRVCIADAVEVLTQNIPDESLDRIHIYFPDPWHKKRHHKRRLIQGEFVKLLVKKLKPHGHLHLATDWQDYAEHMLATCQAEPELENTCETYAPRPETRPLTKFERRGHRLGHGVWDLIFQKRR